MARSIETTAVLLGQVAQAERLAFTRTIEADLARQVRSDAKRLYHRHPWSPDRFNYRDMSNQ